MAQDVLAASVRKPEDCLSPDYCQHRIGTKGCLRLGSPVANTVHATLNAGRGLCRNSPKRPRPEVGLMGPPEGSMHVFTILAVSMSSG